MSLLSTNGSDTFECSLTAAVLVIARGYNLLIGRLKVVDCLVHEITFSFTPLATPLFPL